MDSIIIKLDEEKNYEVREVGGKGKSLIYMKKEGINVPDGFIVSTECFRKYYSADSNQILIDQQIQMEILSAYDNIIGEGSVAVRSSATNEDMTEASYAGQYDSVLYVKRDEIIDAVIKVWKSIENRSKLYKTDGKNSIAEMAVVIQKMIFPDVSGVTFTHFPYIDSQSISIEIIHGGLNKLVSGNISPTNYIIDRETKEYVYSGEEFKEIMDICNWSLEIEKIYDAPSDIEWAIYEKKLYLLQVRSITSCRNEINLFDTFYGGINNFDEWTKGNVSEVLPEEMTPLSWSIWGEILNELLRKSFRHLPEKYNVFNTCFIRLKNGKLEYNIGAINYFTHTIMGFPSMNEIIGGNHIKDLSCCDEQKIYWLRIIKNIKSISHNNETFENLPKLSQKKYVEIHSKVQKWKKVDLSKLTNKELFGIFDEILEYGIENMGLHTDATSASFSYVNLLKYFLNRWTGSEDLVIQLISDVDGIEIACLGEDIQKIINIIRKSENALMIIKALERENWKCILENQNEKIISENICELIEKYGHRGTSELEFAVSNWKEEPRYLLSILMNTYKFGEKKETYSNESEYEKARLELKRKLGHKKIKYKICENLVYKSREYTRLRENNKHHLYLIIAEIKRALREIINRLPKVDLPHIEQSIYYMRIEEIRECLLNGKEIQDAVIIRRYAEYQEYKLDTQIWNRKTQDNSSSLYGLPACLGIVKAHIKILRDPSEIGKLRKGEILVVKTMDIGWSPVFSRISGLITEIGGTLSHAAIVAREYSIPTIVNVPSATDILSDGDEVILNANLGVIQRLNGK